MLFAPVLLALASQTPAQAPTTLADLVPKNTIAFVQAPSLERAAGFVGRMATAFAPGGGPKIDAATLMAMAQMPGDASAVDTARPVGMCLVLEETAGAQPMPVFLMPVSDADKYVKSVAASGMQTVAKAGYVCVGMGAPPELPSAPAAIAKGLPEGELALRLDLGRLVEQYRDTIDQGLNTLEEEGASMGAAAVGGMDVKPMMGAYADFLRDFVDSVQTLDLGLRLDGDAIELGFALTNAEGSALASFGSKEKTGLRALAPLLDMDSGMSMLMGMDMAAMMKRFQPLFDAMPAAYPESMRPMMQQMMGHLPEFYGFLGTAQAASMDFTDTGMRYRVYSRGGDAAKLLQAYRSLASGMPGFTFTDVPQREIAGTKIDAVRFKMDLDALMKLAGEKDKPAATEPGLEKMMEKMFGKDGMLIQIASKEGTAVMVMGGDDDYLKASLARLSSKSAPPAFMARALQQVGDLNPCMIVHYDLGRMLGGMKDVMADVMPMGAIGLPTIALATTMWGGVDGRVWRGALELNLSEIAALAHMGNQAAAPSARIKAKTDILAITMALDEYAINNSGRYPDSLEPLVTPDANGHSYLEGYDGKIPKDPWHNEYRYEPGSAKHPSPRVFSYGSDGAPGGTGDAADIDSDKLKEDDR